MSKKWKGRGRYEDAINKKNNSNVFCSGNDFNANGTGICKWRGETLVETANVQQDEVPEMMSESEVESEAEKVIECE